MTEIFVTCPTGLEDLLVDELRNLGIKKAHKGFRGAYVPKEMESVYKINYQSRFATRVLWPIAYFPCPHREALYKHARKIDWKQFLNLEKTFSIDANVSHPNLRNSLFAALVVKDALCDQLREDFGARPNVNISSPDVQFNLYIANGFATIMFDTSGTPLYKRGYREHTSTAPLQESIAAAILAKINYSSDKEILCDPFCGSGTFLIEAAMRATNTPAGYFRETWGFMHMPQFSSSDWEATKTEANSHIVPLPKGKIFGADKDHQVLDLCLAHLKKTNFQDSIEVTNKDIRSYFPKVAPSLVVCNPPYGKRLQATQEVYQALGQFLQTKCAPAVRAYVLTTEIKLVEASKLPIKEILPFPHGGLETSLYSLYKGDF